MIGDKKSQKNMMIEETIMILAEMRSRGDEFLPKSVRILYLLIFF